jgi:hypothetical protein
MEKSSLVNYKNLTKEKLIFHCESYAESLHDMAIALQKSERENEQSRRRFYELQRIREFLHQ